MVLNGSYITKIDRKANHHLYLCSRRRGSSILIEIIWVQAIYPDSNNSSLDFLLATDIDRYDGYCQASVKTRDKLDVYNIRWPFHVG